MPRILVVEHEAKCPPALLGRWLEDAGATLEVCRPYAGDVLPETLDGYDGLLVLGGSMGAYDGAGHAWLDPLKQLIRSATVPVLGVCLGHQLVAVAYGGEVGVNPRGQQLGLLDVGWTAEAGTDALVGDLATSRRGLQWNDDIVTGLPDGAALLAATSVGEPQVVRFSAYAWGVQLHPEVDEGIVRAWADSDQERHVARGVDQEGLLRELAGARAELERAWRPLADSFHELVDAG